MQTIKLLAGRGRIICSVLTSGVEQIQVGDCLCVMEILVMIKGAMQEVIMQVNIDKGLEY